MSKSLRLDADTIATCESICDGMIDQLSLALDRAQDLTNISGFGTFPSAIELQSGYQEKSVGGSASLVEQLKQYLNAVTHMRAAFSEGGAAYAHSDNAFRRKLSHSSDSGAETV